MTDSLYSWITLSAFIGCFIWYFTRSKDRSAAGVMMCFASALLCLFAGFLFSGAILKLLGSFNSQLIPALLVPVGSACTVVGHHYYQKRGEKPAK